jgi:multicomponent K+:H+ antiporter subunit F/multicomponent Na+:H+ antiporter subunit F
MTTVALLCLLFAVGVAVYRVVRGPSWGDRITAFDFLGVNLAVLIVVLALRSGFESLLDVALLMSIVGFLTTVALTRYLLLDRVLE